LPADRGKGNAHKGTDAVDYALIFLSVLLALAMAVGGLISVYLLWFADHPVFEFSVTRAGGSRFRADLGLKNTRGDTVTLRSIDVLQPHGSAIVGVDVPRDVAPDTRLLLQFFIDTPETASQLDVRLTVAVGSWIVRRRRYFISRRVIE
jgi:hypothetical protein